MLRIAIDGPGGAGKSTIAKLIAKALNIDYVDTGAMYRAVALKMQRKGLTAENPALVEEMLKDTDIDFKDENIVLDDVIVNTEIRKPEMSVLASACSSLPCVREKLVELQRKMGETKDVIMDGRDIGTNVLKNAEFKFFLTASPEERARRRYTELQEKGENVSLETVLKEINERDYKDSNRELNPLTKAGDAIEVDTTGMSIDEVVETILKEIK
jgi:cytidylate kinase